MTGQWVHKKTSSGNSTSTLQMAQFTPRPFAPPENQSQQNELESAENQEFEQNKFNAPGFNLLDVPIHRKPIQTKLTVGAKRDKYEQEADAMASKVMAMTDTTVQRETVSPTGEEVQTKPLANTITPLVQREVTSEEETLQRAPDGNLQAGGNVENQLNASKGGGSPLPDDVRSFMSPREEC